MSNFTYPGAPVPPNPSAVPFNPAIYNGSGPQGPAQSFGQPLPQDKGGSHSPQNGPPFGAPLRPQFGPQGGPVGPPSSGGNPPTGFAPPPSGPQSYNNPMTGTVPTAQFNNMALHDPNKAGPRPGMPPRPMNATTGPPPRPNMPPPGGQINGPNIRGGPPHPSSVGGPPNSLAAAPHLGAGPHSGPPSTNVGYHPGSVGPTPSNMPHSSQPGPMVGQPPHSSAGGPPPHSNIGDAPPLSSMGHQSYPPTSTQQGGFQGHLPPPASQQQQGGGFQGHLPPSASQQQQGGGFQGHLPPSASQQQQGGGFQGHLPPPTSQQQQGGFQGHLPPPGPQQQQGGFQGHLPPPGPQQQQGGGFQGHLPPPTSQQQQQQQFSPPSTQYSMPPQGMMPPTGQPMHPQLSAGAQPGPPAPGQGGQFPAPGSYGQQPIGYPGQQPQPMQPPQQQKRLDPDQMPSPIQVIEDDKRNRAGIYHTNVKGSVPPLVTTKFTTQDQGNANPRFIRSTMYNVPCTADLMKSAHIPFALAVTPFAELGAQEQPPPIVDLGELGPVRCKRCKAYMSPFMQFIDGGRRFQCVFCSAATDVPNEYFAHLDHTGRRMDSYQRAELCLGSYEIVATKDYCKNGVPPKEPAFIFMIDVSYNSVKSGLVQLICDKLKSEILVNLPKEAGADESEIRVGFATYHKELHFYNVKSTLAQPQMMVVSDLEDVFIPLVDGFLVKLSESEAVIDSLLAQIPHLFAESKETELVLGPVIQAGLDALKSADRVGRLYIFHTGLPTAEGPGKLKNRDDIKLLGTEKEKTILAPQTPFYSKLGIECVAAGCSVDLFLFPNQYTDIATISDVCRVTAGNIFKYSFFQAETDGERFIEDLKTSVKRSQAFDAILRVRTSTGIRPVDFYGNFYMANTTDVEMASIDSDSTICLEVKHDDKLSEAEGAFVQVAILYTSVNGQRRLRCHNLSLNCCNQMADLFRSCELDVLVNFFAKQAIRTCLNANPKQVREHITNEVAQILACYRKNCANPSSAGQLVLPECMKLLPLYANCVIKNDSISGGSEITTDNRSYLMHLVNGMDVMMTHVFFYPRLLPVHTLELETSEFPVALRCSVERLEDSGIYILENGLSMFLWIGHNVSPELIQQIFSVPSAAQIDIDKVQLLQLDNPVSRRLCELIAKIREQRSRYLKLTIVRQRDKLQQWFDHFLVEDKGLNAGSSYVDYLCHIHKEIRSILS